MKKQLIFLAVVLLLTLSFFKLNANSIDQISNAKSAMLIDSLENTLSKTDIANNADNYYKLALLYSNISNEKSKQYANNYLSLPDSIKLVSNSFTLLSMLSNYMEIQKKYDSANYYLTKQKGLLIPLHDESNNILITRYLPDYSKQDTRMIFGMPVLLFVLILCILLILVSGYAYIFILKSKYKKKEERNNRKLEEANLKLMDFKDKLQQAVMENTYEKAIELEKISNDIVDLRKVMKKAEDSNYLKNAFLGTMSHQIRTPLSGIMGFSEMLETELAVEGNNDLYEFAKNIRESGEKLISLISNIIDISSIEANILELKTEKFDIGSLIKTIEKDFVIKAKDKGLIFKTKLHPSLSNVVADYENLEKSLRIVVVNAIQYSKKGFVTVSAKNNPEDKSVHIEIKDTGFGIDPKILRLLLNSFDYTKHGSSLTYQGNGLGLILAHRLVTLMNGTLDIKTALNKGTTVTISLPSYNSEQATIERNFASDNFENNRVNISPIVSDPEIKRLKIFVVEDDRMNRLVIEKMLKKAGDIATASDAEDAIKKLKRYTAKGQYFDVLLIDINLPGDWDGMKLLTEIRKRYDWINRTPVIAQTAYAMAGDKDRYLDAGFNDYILKPISKNELMTIIQKQLEIFKNSEK